MATISSLLHIAFGRCTAPDNVLWGSDEQRPTKVLVSHRSDRTMRCIIDPYEVVKMIRYQGDELVRQEQALLLNESADTPPLQSISKDCQEDSDQWDVHSAHNGTEYSYAVKTDVTTATGATRIVANRDRYTPPVSRKSRVKGSQIRVKDKMRDARPSFGEQQNIFYDDFSVDNSIVSRQSSHGSKRDLPPRVHAYEGGCGLALGLCVADKAGDLRREYGRALHLKMKARLGPIFCGPYLKHFPDSPLPKSLDFTRVASPQIIKSSQTDDSATILNIMYGDYVHSYPIQMLVDDSDFMDLGVTGSLGLVKSFEVNLSGQRLKSPNHYKVLLNRRSGVPLAVCALKSPYGSPVVRIYTIKQRVFGQKPAATTKRLGLAWCDSYPLYAWAEFSLQGEFPGAVGYSMYMSSGSDGWFESEPSYTAFHPTIGSPEILVMGRTEREHQRRGCALISLQPSPDDNNHHFSVSVSRGIDPALILCFAAIVDETLENDMRLRLKLLNGEPRFVGEGLSLPRLRRPGQY